MRRTKRTGWLIAAAVVIALFAGAFILQGRVTTRNTEMARVERGEVVVGVEVTGELQALDSTSIGPPEVPQIWEFRISMLAPEGSDVKKGAPIVRFDTSDIEQRLQEKSAERDAAKTEIEQRRASLRVESQEERLRLAEAESALGKAALKLEAPSEILNANDRRQLELEHEVSTREVSYRKVKLSGLGRSAAEEIRVLEAKFRNAAREVERLQQAMRAMTVRSPRDGTVVYVTDRRNEKPKVGDGVWRGRTILQIPDLSRMNAKGEVDEADAGKVFAGQKAMFRLDAHPDREWTAAVSQVGRTVRKVSDSNPNRTLPVQLTLERTDPDLMRPGMRFRGTLITAEKRNVLRVPVDAIFTSPEGAVVHRRTATGMEDVRVETGARGEEWIEIVSGLEEGDQVALRRDKVTRENAE